MLPLNAMLDEKPRGPDIFRHLQWQTQGDGAPCSRLIDAYGSVRKGGMLAPICTVVPPETSHIKSLSFWKFVGLS